MATGSPERSDVYVLASSLWRRRHPDLIPAVRRSLEQLPRTVSMGLHGLRVLLEKSPEALSVWARDPAVPAQEKTEVLVVLQEEVPDTLLLTLPAFISAAQGLSEKSTGRKDEATEYCERLFSLLLMDRARFVVAQPEEVRRALRSVARNLIAPGAPIPSLKAAVVLGLVGHPQDAAFLDAHCPADSTFAKVFQDAARTLRGLQKH